MYYVVRYFTSEAKMYTDIETAVKEKAKDKLSKMEMFEEESKAKEFFNKIKNITLADEIQAKS